MKITSRNRQIPTKVITVVNRFLAAAYDMDTIGARMAVEYPEIQLRWRQEREKFLDMLEQLCIEGGYNK